GRTNCVGDHTECVQEVMPSPERCNALDDDCDGMTDEEDGGALCAEHQICERGTCIDVCFEGGCGPGLTCNDDGHCVDAMCVGVDCPPGERCVGGACVGACDGITCPSPLTCSGG